VAELAELDLSRGVLEAIDDVADEPLLLGGDHQPEEVAGLGVIVVSIPSRRRWNLSARRTTWICASSAGRPNFSTVQRLVALGLGLSIVPKMATDADESDRRVYRPIARGRSRRAIVAAWHPGRHRPRLAERFLEGLRAECGRREGERK
jgi:DNA-binding transcriptional LysR family regulator